MINIITRKRIHKKYITKKQSERYKLHVTNMKRCQQKCNMSCNVNYSKTTKEKLKAACNKQIEVSTDYNISDDVYSSQQVTLESKKVYSAMTSRSSVQTERS